MTDDPQTDALVRGIHELVIADNLSFHITLNPNTLSISIERRSPRHLEGWAVATAKEVVDGEDANSRQRELTEAGAAWLVPLLRRLANGEFVRIAEIEHAGGASGSGRPVSRAPDGTIVPRDPTWKGPAPSPPKRRHRKRR